jgi:hypothetical protein
MTAFTDLSEFVNRATGGNSGLPELISWFKSSRVAGAAAVAPIAGRMISLWEYEGSPAHGVSPGAVAVPTNTTNGGMKQVNPGGAREKWLSAAAGVATVAGTLILYDRLLHISGLDGTVTTAQTVGGALTRYVNGLGNQIWVEIYSAIGSTPTTAVVNYTDQGAAASVSPSFDIGNTNLREAQRMIPVPLASGDTGVQGVTNIDLLASTGGVGNFGITVVHPLVTMPVAILGVGTIATFLDGPFSKIETDACLALMYLPSAVTVPSFSGNLFMLER